jgi:hypothetical protein
VLLVAATALTGCYKESSSKTSEQQWTMNVEASKGGEATKALDIGSDDHQRRLGPRQKRLR